MSGFYNTESFMSFKFEIKKMNKAVLLTPLLLILSLSCSAQSKTKSDFKSLDWIIGEWNRTNMRLGSTASESWEKVSDTMYKGIGISMKGSDTTFVEHLGIEIKSDKVYYVADVRENSTPTYFELVEISATGFISQNLKHDFPKVISYALKGNDLTATISDGGDKKMKFIFSRQ